MQRRGQQSASRPCPASRAGDGHAGNARSAGDGTGARQPELRAWERGPDESGAAYGAFSAFRDLGPTRSVVAAARSLGKHPSQFYRWAKLFDWETRAWQWDLAQSREQEAALSDQRQEIVRCQLRDAERLQRLGMAALTGFVRRDPLTGELTLDRAVTPHAAVQICRLALDTLRAFAPVSQSGPDEPGGPAGTGDGTLDVLSDPDLQELVRLARERAGQDTNPADQETGNEQSESQ